VIGAGFATDLQRLRAAPIPHPRVFDGEFYRLCGSSTIARLDPHSPHALRRDPYKVLHQHYRWIEVARQHGTEPARLPVCGNYVVNTSQNHSEIDGPFSDWRRRFRDAVSHEGEDIDDRFLARFGVRLAQIQAVAARLFALIIP
jgi:hypothetical protein